MGGRVTRSEALFPAGRFGTRPAADTLAPGGGVAPGDGGESVRGWLSRLIGVVRFLCLATRPGVRIRGIGRLDRLPRLRQASGSVVTFGHGCRLYRQVGIFLEDPSARVRIGSWTFINRRTEIVSKDSVWIGDNCAISWDVLITDTDGHECGDGPTTAPVRICDGAWIGARAAILKGVTVGEGAIVAAGAIVTRSVPPATLVAGNPARVIRTGVTWS